MNLFRFCENNFSDDFSLFNGMGAGKFGGRWNSIGIRAIYCSESETACAAEQGFHKIITNINLYKNIGNKKEKKNFSADKLINLQLASVNFDLLEHSLTIADLTTEIRLNDFILKYGLNLTTDLMQLKKSEFYGTPTRQIGDCASENKLAGIRVLSARCHESIVVLYPQNIPREKLVVVQRDKIKVHGVGINGKKLQLGSEIDDAKVIYEKGKKNQIIKILEF